MVEMRWLLKERSPEEMALIIEGSVDQHYQVLQYRVFRTHRIEGDIATPIADWAQGWSEWMDVEKVIEKPW